MGDTEIQPFPTAILFAIVHTMLAIAGYASKTVEEEHLAAAVSSYLIDRKGQPIRILQSKIHSQLTLEVYVKMR